MAKSSYDEVIQLLAEERSRADNYHNPGLGNQLNALQNPRPNPPAPLPSPPSSGTPLKQLQEESQRRRAALANAKAGKVVRAAVIGDESKGSGGVGENIQGDIGQVGMVDGLHQPPEDLHNSAIFVGPSVTGGRGTEVISCSGWRVDLAPPVDTNWLDYTTEVKEMAAADGRIYLMPKIPRSSKVRSTPIHPALNSPFSVVV